MSRKKTILGLVIFIFISAVCWQLFLTSGFNFFWEDFYAYQLDFKNSEAFDLYFKGMYSLDGKESSRLSLGLTVLKGYAKYFFASHQLFQIGFTAHTFSDRPYQVLTLDLLKLIFSDKAILYRIFKAIIFAINTCLVFLIINRASRLLALLGILLYMASAEIWLSAIYLSCLMPLAQCGEILSIMLFIKLTEKHPLHYKDAMFYYFLIILTSNFAVLITSGGGRYLATIFFLTILFFRKKELRFHLPMLVILFFMEFPALGYIKKIFRPDFSPINFASHYSPHHSTLESLRLIVRNYKIPQNAIGNLLLITLAITILAYLLRFIFGKNTIISKKIEPFNPILKERLFLFMLWFASTFAISARAYSFCFTIFSLYLFDLSYFIAPFIIFLCYYISLISSSIKKPYRAVFVGVCICLMGLQVLCNGPRLNRFRGAWGNYFVAWQNVEQYINHASNNALALTLNNVGFSPFLFRNSNNKILNSLIVKKENFSKIVNDPERLFSDLVKNGYIDEEGIIQSETRRLRPHSKLKLPDTYITKQAEIYREIENYELLSPDRSPFCDLGYIERKFKEGGYKDVFVAGMEELKFRGDSEKVTLEEIKVIDGYSEDLYDRLKRAIGHPSNPLIHLYHFKYKEK